MTPAAPFIVCERSGLWAAALRWQSSGRSIAIQEVRSLIDARTIAMQSPIGIVALEATAATAEGVLRLMLELQRVCPASRCIVLMANDVRDLAQLYQEAGAAYVALSPRQLEHLIRVVEWHRSLQLPPEETPRDRVWSRLPWGGEEV